MRRRVDAVCAIMAGGSGTRFWPVSRVNRPKQMLPLGSGPKSLLRDAYERAARACGTSRVLVVTARRLVDAVAAQLPELDAGAILGEPTPRSTAPCIAWAAARVVRDLGDVPIAALPSDHRIDGDDQFVAALGRAAELARDGWIVTFGIRPHRPETGYGYVRAGADLGSGASAVGAFIEKPDAARAAELAAEPNVFWNSGMFVFSAERILAEIAARLPETARLARELREAPADREPEIVDRLFPACESISIDYGIMEEANRVAVVKAEFEWSDIGSWDALAESASNTDDPTATTALGPTAAKVEMPAVGSARSLVWTENAARKAVAIVGADDLIVVDTDDALLVCRRGASQDVRAVVDALRKRRRDDLL